MPNPSPEPSTPTGARNEPPHVNLGVLEHSVGYCCLQAYLEVVPNIKKQLSKLRLRPVEYTVLSLINNNPDINQKRLGQSIKVSPPNLATLLDKLQSDGLVIRQRNPDDRRSQILALTLKGHALCLKAEQAAIKADATPMLSESERQQLTTLLTKIFQP